MAALILALMCGTIGCSIIGLGIDLHDFPSSEGTHLSDQTLDGLPGGALLRVYQTDGRADVGINLGIVDLPDQEWSARYTAARDTNPALEALPAIGDSILVLQSGFWRMPARFLGLQPGGIVICDHDGRDARVLGYDDIARLQWHGGSLWPGELRALAEGTHLPSRRQLRLATDSDTLLLSADQIAGWKLMRRPARVPWGFLVGLSLDYLSIVHIWSKIGLGN